MIHDIGVAGAGQMGSGIAQVCAAAGYGVSLFDVVPGQAERAKATIEKNLRRLVDKGVMTAGAAAAALARIRPSDGLEGFSGVDLAIEAASENEALKTDLFRALDGILGPAAMLASNTSSIPITALAAVTGRPERVIGMHFMNPVPVMRLVEIIRGHRTDDDTFAAVGAVVSAVGKEAAVSRDYPGFIVNRILVPMLNEAAFAVYEGLASPQDIDKAMTLGTNQPMGPLALADFIGLDTVVAIMEVMFAGFGDPKYRPCPLLKNMVRAGLLGKKSGRGFYAYA